MRNVNNEACQRKIGSKRIYNFREARKIARSLGFHSRDEFVEYECAGSYQLPKNVDELYAAEWKGWDDFLGVPLPFEEARTIARGYGFQNKEDYLKLKEQEANKCDDDDDILRLPYRPDLFYQQWINWEDWLGFGKH